MTAQRPDLPDAGRDVLVASVRPVARRGRGPVLVGALVVGAFLLGLLRPWDLVPGGTGDASAPAPGATAGVVGGGPAGERTAPPAPFRSATCAFPMSWRTATIESWNDRQARVWTAADVVEADGPDDPAIPFEPVIAQVVTAIGWCAPADGPDRPPLTAVATLFRIVDGSARPMPYDRLEPGQPDALGELWVPVPTSIGRRPPWPIGRYVIRLATPSGGYERYLGLEVTDRPPQRPTTAPPGSPAPSGSPGPTVLPVSSPSPGATPAP